MADILIWQVLILLLALPLALLPSIIAFKKNHPYKIAIVLTNLLGGLLWGAGWVIALIWCFVVPGEHRKKI